MVSLKELCEEYKKKHGINTNNSTADDIPPVLFDVVGITPDEPCLVCVGGRPAMGRTAFYLDLILKIALTPDKTILFFLDGTMFEQDTELIIDRFLRRLCGANNYSVIKNADSEELGNNTKSVPAALNFLEKLNVYFDTCKFPFPDYIKECISKYNKVGLVVIGDTEHIVPDNDNKVEKENAVREAIEQLSILTKERNMPIVLSTVLSRGLERRINKRPNIRDLKFKSLTRLSDTVALLYRSAYYTLKNDDSAEILLAKNRKGNTGWIKIKFDYNTLSFTK